MLQHLSWQGAIASIAARLATWLETADLWSATNVEPGDTWPGTVGIETIGTRETDRGCLNPKSRGYPQQPVSAHTTTLAHIPTLIHTTCTNRVAYTYGTLDSHKTLMLLDSRASCSVMSKSCIPDKNVEPIQSTKLVNADGRDIIPYGSATMTVGLGQYSTSHKFVAK